MIFYKYILIYLYNKKLLELFKPYNNVYLTLNINLKQ